MGEAKSSVSANAIQAVVGGLLAGSAVGLTEAVFLLATTGAPDWFAPHYAVVLYGLIGVGLGLATAVAVAIASSRVVITQERALAIGAVGAIVPLGLFILRYVVNKEVYAERGIPLVGNLAILAVIGAVSAMVLLAVPALLRGPAKFLLKAPGSIGSWLAVVVLTAIVAFAFPAANPRNSWAHARPAPAGKPNVLLIMVDTLRADHLGTYGSTVPTPVIDALAGDGIVYEHAFSNASWTRASGASLLTSRIPSGHATAQKAARLPDSVVTWAEALRPAGYTTGALVNNINLSQTFNFDQGYDTFIYEAPDYRFGATESVFGLSMYKVVQKVSEKVLGKHKDVTRFYQPADVVLADAEGFITANPSGFALYVHLMEPHDPYFEHPNIAGTGTDEYNGVGFARAEVENPDPKDAEYLKRVYSDEVAFLDTKLAPFVRWLKDNGHYDDTLIVLTADHGEEFNEHGGFWHGTTLYDEQIHVPLIVKLPRQEHAGARVPWQVRSIDIVPTIAAVVGVPPDPSWEGEELVTATDAFLAPPPPPPPSAPPPAVEGAPAAPPVPEPPPTPVLADPCAPDPLDRPLIAEEDFEGNVIHAYRDGKFKYIAANTGNPRGLPEESLFHVIVDPGELTNLAHGTTVCAAPVSSRTKAMEAAAQAGIAKAKQTATSGGDAKMDRAECENLKALGYHEGPCD
jgi:arylsulfatase A-like enzyme